MRTLVLMIGLALMLGACGDDENSGGGDMQAGDTTTDNGNVMLAENCSARCDTKATSCGAPAATAAEVCNGLCGNQVTEEQAQCLENSQCAALTAVITGSGTVCDIGTSSGTCGDGTCDANEDANSCAQDCGGSGMCNNNGTCDSGETLSSCPSDCQMETGNDYGESCDCGNNTISCEGTENGCRWSFSPADDPLECLVNSDERTTGFCTRSCDPDNDDCPSGMSCTAYYAYYDLMMSMEPFYKCE